MQAVLKPRLHGVCARARVCACVRGRTRARVCVPLTLALGAPGWRTLDTTAPQHGVSVCDPVQCNRCQCPLPRGLRGLWWQQQAPVACLAGKAAAWCRERLCRVLAERVARCHMICTMMIIAVIPNPAV